VLPRTTRASSCYPICPETSPAQNTSLSLQMGFDIVTRAFIVLTPSWDGLRNTLEILLLEVHPVTGHPVTGHPVTGHPWLDRHQALIYMVSKTG